MRRAIPTQGRLFEDTVGPAHVPDRVHTLARQIPDARFARLAGIGHMLHQVATAQVMEIIEAAASRHMTLRSSN